ncbi:PqqD family peptide modification chaperone [Rathayibacter sp. VKM Ac-2803]|uniref:PqqD family peptide modification chaperone n=1 Tax=Rathayibacter sp. VKM Ac-2803 TaxID=2609256 RepID=UPI00135CE111|nr:PqqD family peptide modification chaperone [Rathayibacter sp. VKM Ac-2803]MWV50415.1 PqqD family peptide modification chaperone [Rathayibacter sp. VKM Ac-2803]
MRKDDEIEELPLAVAVDLAHALVAGVAESAGIRALFIKGPIANFHRVRPHRISSDVDVLVHPTDVNVLRDELMKRGWVERPESFAHRSFVTHSLTLLHPDWPCDVDVHRSFPGFLNDDDNVFEELWRRRIEVEIASRPVVGTDFSSSVVIAALHALRAMYLDRHAQEFDQALTAVRESPQTDVVVEELRQLALDTGATTTLAPFLTEFGLATQQVPVHGRKYLEWQRNTRQLNRAASWISAILEVRLIDRPRFLWRAVFPGVEDLLIDHPATPRTSRGVMKTWFLRLVDACRALPTAVRIVRRERSRASFEQVVRHADRASAAVSHSGGQISEVPVARRVLERADESRAPSPPLTRAERSAPLTDADDIRPLRRAAGVAAVDRGESTFLLPVRSTVPGLPLLVAGSGRAVWDLLETPRSLESVVFSAAADYGVSPSDIRGDVSRFVTQLLEAHVLEVADA